MKDLAQAPLQVYTELPPPYLGKEGQPPYCTVHLFLHTDDWAQDCHRNHTQPPTTDMTCTSINDIAAVLNDDMDFGESLTTTTTTLSVDSTPVAVTTTAATTTGAATMAATTTAATAITEATSNTATSTAAISTTVTTYTISSDIATIASDPSPVTLVSATLSHLSGEFCSNRPVRLLQHPVEIAAQELSPQNKVNFILKIFNLFGDITDAANAQVAWLSNFAERNLHWKKLKYKR